MGFFQKIKNKLGIGGVKVRLDVPAEVPKQDEGEISGKIILTTKSEQEIVDMEVKVVEEYTTGRGDDQSTSDIELGLIKLDGGFSIKPGETKEVPFTVPYRLVKSNNDELKEKGGALGALGKVSAFASGEKSKYFVEADVDVKSAALDPSDRQQVKLVN